MFEPTETESKETLDAFADDLVEILARSESGPDALVIGRGAPGGRVGGHVADAEDSELHVFLSDESKLIEL